MGSVSRSFRSTVSPTVALGTIAVSLLAAVMIVRYTTTQSQTGATHSTIETTIESSQSNNASIDFESKTLTDSQTGVSSNISNSPTTSESNTPTVESSVTVNGEMYAVPPSGELNQTVVTDDGQTSINISSHSSGSGDADRSSSRVRVFSRSSSVNQSSESVGQ